MDNNAHTYNTKLRLDS